MPAPTLEAGLGLTKAAGPVEYKFYNGEVSVFYDDAEHTYTRFDKEGLPVIIPGVTSAVHIIDKSGPLTQWASNMCANYIRDMIAEHKVSMQATFGGDGPVLVDIDDVLSWLDPARFNFNEYKNKAADTGKVAHDWVEQYIKARIREDWGMAFHYWHNRPEDERSANGVTAAFEWMSGHNVEWIFTERKIYSRVFDYAGTLDGYARISSCGNPECCGRVNPETGEREAVHFENVLAVIDWKTSNNLYEEYEYQTAAYDHAIREELGMVAEYRVVIRLGKEDAQFEARLLFQDTYERDFKIFLQCLALYTSVDGRKRHDRAVRDQVKSVLKAKKQAAIEAEKQRKREEKEALKAAKEEIFNEFRSQGMSIKAAKTAVAVAFKRTDIPEQDEIEEAAQCAEEEDLEEAA